MRRIATVALLLCWAHTGLAEESSTPCRCVLAARPGGLKTVADTATPELDKRIRSELSFLTGLFGVEPEFVLLAGDAARKAFAVAGGKGTVLVSAAWMKKLWGGEHRVGTVATVLAHQYAHILQEKRKCALQEWSRERHADFLAGWYLGKRNVATLGSGADLDAAFAAALFAARDEFLNARFDHGTPDLRASAMRQGFSVFRSSKLSLDKTYDQGLTLFPPPNEGLADGAEKPAGLLGRVKVECLHKGPCNHEVACEHPKPCTHKVACKHESPCVHHRPCVHREPCSHHTPCVHKTRCVHRTRCEHHVPCVHTVPCKHYDADGNPMHNYDYLHNFDYEHEYDYEHEWDYEHEHDTEHEYDIPHEFDTEHPFDPIHEFDMAHEWDPIHDFDLAHEWDPLHDYDVRFVPQGDAEGAPGAK
jgi:hypothetical protein